MSDVDLNDVGEDIKFYMMDVERSQVIYYRDKVKDIYPNSTIYLFGSMTKGCIKNDSDIDLLVLLKNTELTYEERTEESIKCRKSIRNVQTREVDIKMYGEIDYRRIMRGVNFESDIVKDLVDITNWKEKREDSIVPFLKKD